MAKWEDSTEKWCSLRTLKVVAKYCPMGRVAWTRRSLASSTTMVIPLCNSLSTGQIQKFLKYEYHAEIKMLLIITQICFNPKKVLKDHYFAFFTPTICMPNSMMEGN